MTWYLLCAGSFLVGYLIAACVRVGQRT